MKVFAYNASGLGHPAGSVRAVRACVQRGLDLTLTLRLTKDKVWVVSPGRSEQAAFRTHNRTASQLGLLTLDEACAILASFGNPTVLLDIQDHGEFRALAAAIASSGLQRRMVCCLWDPAVIETLHRVFPELVLGYSVPPGGSETVTHRSSRKGLAQHFHTKRSFEAKGMAQFDAQDLPAVPLRCVNLFALSCTRTTVAGIQERGVRVNGYLAGARITQGLLQRVGVDGVITGSPRAS